MAASNFALDLKDRVDLRDIVSIFWGQPARHTAKSAIHYSRWRDDGSKPSFHVQADHFKDFGGAGEHGDVYTFLQRELSLSFRDAVKWLQAYLGGHIQPAAPRPAVIATSPNEPPPGEWQTAARAKVQWAQDYLWSDRPDARRVLAYLRNERGLTDETIRAAGLGYNPAWSAVNWKHPETGQNAKLAPGIIIPYAADGALWSVRVRCRVGNLADALGIPNDSGKDGDELPKYLNLTGSKPSGALYNADAVQPGCTLLFTEGEFDALLAQQVLSEAATVVTLGSATNSLSERRLKQVQTADKIFLILDNDTAGRGAQDKLRAALGEKATPLELPGGKDITDFIVKYTGDLRAMFTASRAWWPGGIPDSWRSALLGFLPDRCAPLVELLNQSFVTGQLDPDSFTAPDVCAIGERQGFDKRTIYRALADLENICLVTKCHIDSDGTYRTFCHSFTALPLRVFKTELLARAGYRLGEKHHPIEDNRVLIYVKTDLLTADGSLTDVEAKEKLAAVRSALEPAYARQGHVERKAAWRAVKACERLERSLDDLHSTPLPDGWPLSSAKLYRAAFLRAKNDPETPLSRREIAALVGVSERRVGTVIQDAGLKGEPQIKPSGPIVSADKLPLQIQQISRELKGFARRIIIEKDGRKVEEKYDHNNPGEAVSKVETALQLGASVTVELQTANKYTPVRETPPPQKPAPLPPAPLWLYPRVLLCLAQVLLASDVAEETGDDAPVIKPPAHTIPAISSKPRFFGKGYDPRWARAQLLYALELLEHPRVQDCVGRSFDTVTGIILDIRFVTIRDFVDILLTPLDYDALEYDCRALGGVVSEIEVACAEFLDAKNGCSG